jgi:hypothetical protein
MRFFHLGATALIGHVTAAFFFLFAHGQTRDGAGQERRREHHCRHRQVDRFAKLTHVNSLFVCQNERKWSESQRYWTKLIGQIAFIPF